MDEGSKPKELSDGLKRLTQASADRLKAKTTPTPDELRQRREGKLRRDAQKLGFVASKRNVKTHGTKPWLFQNLDGEPLLDGLSLEEAEVFLRTGSA
jgi:hypothetical protein